MPEPTTSKENFPRRRWWIRGVAATLLIGGGAGLGLWKKSVLLAPHFVDSQPIVADAWRHKLILGVWEVEYQGKRTMTLNEDGTGVMVVELSGWRAALSAARLKFDMKWSVEGGRLKKHSTGGQPEAQVRLILSTMGDHVEEPILELTENRLLLLDQNGATKYDWKRVKAAGAANVAKKATPQP